jgi:hypothetical protein
VRLLGTDLPRNRQITSFAPLDLANAFARDVELACFFECVVGAHVDPDFSAVGSCGVTSNRSIDQISGSTMRQRNSGR